MQRQAKPAFSKLRSRRVVHALRKIGLIALTPLSEPREAKGCGSIVKIFNSGGVLQEKRRQFAFA
jgi:hypothetical protein